MMLLLWPEVAAIVPFAIAVDQAENLDPISIAMLTTLTRQRDARGLLVLAVNIDLEHTHGPAGGNPDLSDWLEEETRMDRLSTLTLHGLSPEELADLALHKLGETTPSDSSTGDGTSKSDLSDRLAVVVEAAGHNPGRLSRLLAVPTVRKALLDPQRTLPADLDRYAHSELLEDAFAALPGAERDTLATLALHGPATQPGLLPDDIDQKQLDRAVDTGWVIRSREQITFASRAL